MHAMLDFINILSYIIRAPIHFKADLGLRRGGFVWDSCDDMKFWM